MSEVRAQLNLEGKNNLKDWEKDLKDSNLNDFHKK